MGLFSTNYAKLPDKELLKLLGSNNEFAFKTLYSRYSDFLYKTAMSYLSDESIAKDMIQEVFITLYTRRKDLNHITELKGWLFRCLRNRILNEIRNTRLHQLHHEQLLNQTITVSYTQEKYDLNLLEKQYQNALDQLNRRSRLVFLLSRKDNLSNKSIAEKLEVSVKAVEKHITNALKIMRRELAGRGK